MSNPFKVNKENEFFISVAVKGGHSFMMVGVIDNDGSPRLLARVGKQAITSKVTEFLADAIWDGAASRITDEGVFRKADFTEEISYSAYSINYEQAKEFLGIIAEIEKKQQADPILLSAKAISCYIPIENKKNNEVTFEHSKLNEHEFLTTAEARVNPLAEGAKLITVSNTCRSSALNIVEAILGFATNVSKLFFISPDYKTELKGGNPDKQTFYVLPPPPMIKKEEFSKAQYKMLDKMYKQLEEIPKSNPEDPATRAKFDALKETYNSIFGKNKLSASELLTKLNDHAVAKGEALFAKRSQNLVSKALGFTSSTERMFVDIKNKLVELKENGEDQENTRSKTQTPK